MRKKADACPPFRTRCPEIRPVVERFNKKLFAMPWCDNKGDASPCKRPKREAINFERIQPNGPRWIHYLCVDIDRPYPCSEGVPNLTILEAMDFVLPPNLVVMNTQTGKAHWMYELARPVWEDPNKPQPKPVRFMKSAQSGLANNLHRIGADRSFTGFMVKNPFHACHEVFSFRERPYDLWEFAENLDLTYAARPTEGNGRNTRLFEALGEWARRNRHAFDTRSDFEATLLNEALEVNRGFPTALPFSEVRSVVRSVGKYVWERWDGRYRGVMNLDSALPLVERQRLGQAHVCQMRRGRTRDRLISTYRSIYEEQGRCTQALVAERSGIGLRTTKKYWSEVLRVGLTSENRQGLPCHDVTNMVAVTAKVTQPETGGVLVLDSNISEVASAVHPHSSFSGPMVLFPEDTQLHLFGRSLGGLRLYVKANPSVLVQSINDDERLAA
ncbi:replication initiation protein [Azospirillum sp. TSO5]|uniref:replication initiation protein n=1 Tax=Azospirillum sp. TSO5 TaxID=716760 RepID=UPI000D64B5EF|nr:replication initiation protein [Azospirillum sp. TSO5]